MTLSETSVIIAGAGPVGLGLACELGLRGVECMLIEKRDGAITVPVGTVTPRAQGLGPPSVSGGLLSDDLDQWTRQGGGSTTW